MRRRRAVSVRVAILCVTVSLAILHADAQERREPAPLFHAFLWGFPLPSDVLGKLPPDIRIDVERRLSLRKSYKPRLVVSNRLSGAEEEVTWKRQQLEVFVVAVVGNSAISLEASEFARESYMAYEWEGYSGGPMAEASAVGRFIDKHPRTAIASALHAFMLHRFRCAFEAATWANDRNTQVTTAEAYRASWERLQKTQDPVVREIAQEIESEPYLYIRTDLHPRRSEAQR